MKVLVLIAVSLTCLVQLSMQASSDCVAKVTTFHECLQAGHDDGKADKAKADKEKLKADLKKKADDCFTQSKCKAPSFDDDDDDDDEADKPDQKNPDAVACFKGLKDEKKASLKKCVQDKMPGWEALLDQAKGGKGGKGGKRGGFHHGGWGKHGKGGFGGGKDGAGKDGASKKLDEICANGGNKTLLMECFKKMMPAKPAVSGAAKPTDAELKAKFDAMCSNKKKCQDALGADCQAQLKQYKQTSCTCRQSSADTLDTLKGKVPACSKVAPKAGKKPAGAGAGAKKQKSCDAADDKEDPCTLGYDAWKSKIDAAREAHKDARADAKASAKASGKTQVKTQVQAASKTN